MIEIQLSKWEHSELLRYTIVIVQSPTGRWWFILYVAVAMTNGNYDVIISKLPLRNPVVNFTFSSNRWVSPSVRGYMYLAEMSITDLDSKTVSCLPSRCSPCRLRLHRGCLLVITNLESVLLVALYFSLFCYPILATFSLYDKTHNQNICLALALG